MSLEGGRSLCFCDVFALLSWLIVNIRSGNWVNLPADKSNAHARFLRALECLIGRSGSHFRTCHSAS